YVGDGESRWPAVHRLDAARAFRLTVEKAKAGSIIQPVDDEGIPSRVIAETIGRHLNLPVTSVAPEEASDHFGWIGPLFSTDAPATSSRTRELLDWRPEHENLLDDLDA